MRFSLCLLLQIVCWLILPAACFAQQVKWPRNSQSGRVEFVGVLLWPVQATNPAQQQNLVRDWYIAKLTNENPEEMTTSSNAEFTYAGLPAFTYLDSTVYPHDKWKIHSIRLLYQVHLQATLTGLAYRLSDFECADIIFDTGSSAPLEEVLSSDTSKEMLILAVFYKHLCLALANW